VNTLCNDQHALESACLAAKGDDAIPVRLAYADWLEERGDPLASILRLACEDLSCPASSPPDYRRVCSCDRCIKRDMLKSERELYERQMIEAVNQVAPPCWTCRGVGIVDATLFMLDPIPQREPCPRCSGTGRQRELAVICPQCKGHGRVAARKIDAGKFVVTSDFRKCGTCDGYNVLLLVEARPGDLPVDSWERLYCLSNQLGAFIESPLLPLWRYMLLTLDDRADRVRRANVAGLF